MKCYLILQCLSGGRGPKIEVNKSMIRWMAEIAAECCISPHVPTRPSFHEFFKTIQANPRATIPDCKSLLCKSEETYLAAVMADTIAEIKKAVVDANTQGVAGNL